MKLRNRIPDTGEVRTVTVSPPDELSIDTPHRIAQKAGANDFLKVLDATDVMI